MAIGRATYALLEQLEPRTLFGFGWNNGSQVPPLGTPCPNTPVLISGGPSEATGPGQTSTAPVQYSNGDPIITSVDLQAGNMPIPFSYTREWTGVDNASENGNGWAISDLPYLVILRDQHSGSHTGEVIVVDGPDTLIFSAGGPDVDNLTTEMTPLYANLDTMKYVAPTTVGGTEIPGTFVLTDPQGDVTTFYDVPRGGGNLPNTNVPGIDADGYYAQQPTSNDSSTKYEYGAMASYKDAAGNEITTSFDSYGNLASLTETTVTGAQQQLALTYTTLTNSLGASAPVVSEVTLQERESASDDLSTAESAQYTYYTGVGSDDQNGRFGDLELAQIYDSAGDVTNQKYYRYYALEAYNYFDDHGLTDDPATTDSSLPGFNSNYSNAVISAIKSVTEDESFDRLSAYATAHDTDIDALADSDIEPYAQLTFNYSQSFDSDYTPVPGITYSGDDQQARLQFNSPGYSGSSLDDYMFWNGYGYSSSKLQYYVSQETAQGVGCSSCDGGVGTFQYLYRSNESASVNLSDPNQWAQETIEFLPDNTPSDWNDNDLNLVFTNELGEVLMTVRIDNNGTDTTSDNTSYATYYRYTDDPESTMGELAMIAQQSALVPFPTATIDASDGYWETTYGPYNDLVGYDPQTHTYANLSADSGLITTIDYPDSTTGTTATSTTAGDVLGYQKSTSIEQGYDGTPIKLNSENYIARTDSTGDTIYPVNSYTTYFDVDGDGSDDAETTNYSYTWYTGTLQVQSMTTTYPVVSTAENGPGGSTGDEESEFFDIDGRPIWFKDGDGHISYTQYDPETGAVVEQIQDVNYSDLTTDQKTLFDQTGWSQPVGLNLVTSYQVDGLGRTTKMTDPNGNVTYTVYNDAAREVRVYPGWHEEGSTWTTTGPIQVTREIIDGTPDGDVGQVYEETLTSSATPTGSGVPTGLETIDASNIQSLTRSLTNLAGQTVEVDAYFSLAGVTYSQTDIRLGSESNDSSAGNYYATTYAFDGRGRLDREEDPTGTITRYIYNGLDNITQIWVGTDDTTTTGYWSPTNTAGANLVEVSSDQYDGDDNLTVITQYPDGTSSGRETDNFYDWRDRLSYTMTGVTQHGNAQDDTPEVNTGGLTYHTVYNTQDQPILEETYAGQSLGFTDGVMDAPDASKLRSKQTIDYDNQGRAYRTSVFSVDPITGDVSTNALVTNTYYDRSGNVIATSAPGGLWTKTAYDGADRPTAVYQTDGATGTTWTDAAITTDDHVLDETDTFYDSNGNVIETADLQRNAYFEDAGNLIPGSSSTVYYSTNYYDAANRLIDSVYIGSNGGSFYSRPSTPPTPSFFIRVTGYSYDPAGNVQDVTDPAGVVTRTDYDMLSRTTQTIADYTDGTPTDDSNQTTAYTYDGMGNILTQSAILPGDEHQTTAYVYGVSQSSSPDASTIDSNDLLAAVEYPDPTLSDTDPQFGDASSSVEETYTYDALGEKLTYTDRNGTTHTYTYDTLGRLTLDSVVGNLGTNVDDAVQELGYSYNDAGQPYQYTSYDGSGNVVNQVEDKYNGLGQLIAEYQSNDGAVNESTTPVVQYVYNEMANGTNNSRLTQMIYPNGRTLEYSYDAATYNNQNTIDDSISRLDGLADDGTGMGNLATYYYSGLDKPVEQDLATGTDEAIGYDRWNNIGSQTWTDSTGFTTDSYDYSRDVNGNITLKTYYNGNYSMSQWPEMPAETYSYDALNRLTGYEQGTYNMSSQTMTTADNTQSWSLDANGNWSSVTTNGTPQTYTVNAQNQLETAGDSSVDYDANGNLTGYPDDDISDTYDAWNRLVRATQANGLRQDYTYDAKGQRIIEQGYSDGDIDNYSELYFSNLGQVIEERNSTGQTTVQNVWSPLYFNALVLSDQYPTNPGSFDSSFGDGGIVVTNGTSAYLTAVTLDSDGRTLAAGTDGGNVAVARYNADGTLDTTFGTNGIATVNFGENDVAYAILSMPNGDILVAGKTENYPACSSVLAMFNSDGTLDTSFGTNGTVTVNVSSNYNVFLGLALQADGKILACSYAQTSTDADIGVTRFNADGSLDTTFGTNGTALIDTGGWNGGSEITELSDGTILVAGSADGNFCVAKLNSDGTLDTSFGTDGLAEINIGSNQSSTTMKVLPNGEILLAGHANNDFAMVRLNADGAVDDTFGTDGHVITAFSAASAIQGLVIEPDGKIVAVGYSGDDIVLAGYNSDGSLDTRFGTNGTVTTDLGATVNTSGEDIAVAEPDGSIMVADGAGGDFVLARYVAGPQRLWVEQDMNNWNVVGITDNTGKVVEHYRYDPYGNAHIFDGSWNSETTSSYNWNYLFQGGRLELTGLYIFQHRDYDPTTGRWIEQDPAGYVDGSNLYQFVDSNPVTRMDPSGMDMIQLPGGPPISNPFGPAPTGPVVNPFPPGRVETPGGPGPGGPILWSPPSSGGGEGTLVSSPASGDEAGGDDENYPTQSGADAAAQALAEHQLRCYFAYVEAMVAASYQPPPLDILVAIGAMDRFHQCWNECPGTPPKHKRHVPIFIDPVLE